ncbi:dual specificity phosphatase, catalytic domain-containing protein [Ditylenchus destructor]|uniref:Dual specificity phosphatase, catalytic domain-containing protein n=1 Tax=Ditylenchus destructor TaxID=166010 RepID=A0AAD4R0E8_9BILA|nr:dual specificity phosphatase, catalytic domain-containing protein [Ditylenchus destructor]
MNHRKRKAQNGVVDSLNGVENGDWSAKKKSAVKMGLPNRWLYCPPMGKVVAERFLPMKTPMSTIYDPQIEPKYQFHPQDVFERQIIGAKAGAKIGLWMDFTKTDRYYDRREVEKNGCAYIKMPLEGHGQTPTEEETTEFISEAKKFFQNHPNDVIAMHCTHGFNRTGFLIVSFLVEEEEYAVDMAVEEFAKARPQGIYKQDYLNELSKRFGDEEDIIPAPNRPLWEHGPVTDEDYYNGVMAKERQEEDNTGMRNIGNGPSTSNGTDFLLSQ